MTPMVALIGEQPVPNLLPLLHVSATDGLLVFTQRTAPQKDRLNRVLKGRTQIHELEAPPYDIAEINRRLEERLSGLGWNSPDLVFNLTGGTKAMAFAAYDLAVRWQKDFMYFQTEGGRSLVYRYATASGSPVLIGVPEQVGTLLTIDDYLRLHAKDYNEEGTKEPFEKMVYDALKASPLISEVRAGIRTLSPLEIDLVIRCGNQIGIAEIKHHAKKQGIDQLHSASEQRHLGTYAFKFLISAAPVDQNNKDLADAYKIEVIELTSAASGSLSSDDADRLVQTVTRVLGARP